SRRAGRSLHCAVSGDACAARAACAAHQGKWTLMPGARPDCDETHTSSFTHQEAPPRTARHAQGARRKASRGQALVELALIVPILVLMLAIAADFGRALTAYITVSSAAREGAAYGMLSEENAHDT